MSDLPKNLRDILDNSTSLMSVTEDKILTSGSTKKALLKLQDGLKIETVLMDYDDWQTACISSQVGCPLGCAFCATGKMGFKRNLTVDEIVDQIIYWKNKIVTSPLLKGDRGRLRIVFMGMGEPFLNWDNVRAALKIISEDLVIGARKISISTAGVVEGINEFTKYDSQINLAISLHSADQKTRESIMPIARTNKLDDLLKAVMNYANVTRRQVFFEYALINGLNDTPDALAKLIKFIKSHPLFYLNLIPLNPIKDGLVPSNNLKYFQTELDKSRVEYSVRRTFGSDINSACGQLITSN
jgi:23S rRNA (adenine2503-C2)-methyltransferase